MKGKSSRSTLKILQSSWGIHIGLEGVSEEAADHRFALDLAFDFPKLSLEEILFLQRGFNSMVKAIHKQNGKFWHVRITSLSIIPTDYQAEGLYYAMALWLSEHFDIELPAYPCHFDRATNRYLFPDLD